MIVVQFRSGDNDIAIFDSGENLNINLTNAFGIRAKVVTVNYDQICLDNGMIINKKDIVSINGRNVKCIISLNDTILITNGNITSWKGEVIDIGLRGIMLKIDYKEKDILMYMPIEEILDILQYRTPRDIK